MIVATTFSRLTYKCLQFVLKSKKKKKEQVGKIVFRLQSVVELIHMNML